jgi:glucokinase
MPELFVREVEKAANKRVMPAFKKSFRVVPAELGDEATVLGAAAWARNLIAGRTVPQTAPP